MKYIILFLLMACQAKEHSPNTLPVTNKKVRLEVFSNDLPGSVIAIDQLPIQISSFDQLTISLPSIVPGDDRLFFQRTNFTPLPLQYLLYQEKQQNDLSVVAAQLSTWLIKVDRSPENLFDLAELDEFKNGEEVESKNSYLFYLKYADIYRYVINVLYEKIYHPERLLFTRYMVPQLDEYYQDKEVVEKLKVLVNVSHDQFLHQVESLDEDYQWMINRIIRQYLLYAHRYTHPLDNLPSRGAVERCSQRGKDFNLLYPMPMKLRFRIKVSEALSARDYRNFKFNAYLVTKSGDRCLLDLFDYQLSDPLLVAGQEVEVVSSAIFYPPKDQDSSLIALQLTDFEFWQDGQWFSYVHNLISYQNNGVSILTVRENNFSLHFFPAGVRVADIAQIVGDPLGDSQLFNGQKNVVEQAKGWFCNQPTWPLYNTELSKNNLYIFSYKDKVLDKDKL